MLLCSQISNFRTNYIGVTWNGRIRMVRSAFITLTIFRRPLDPSSHGNELWPTIRNPGCWKYRNDNMSFYLRAPLPLPPLLRGIELSK